MIKLLTVIGARPQIIKAAALSRAIRNSFSDRLQEIILHTGQHYDRNMSQVFFDELEIPHPDFNLNVGSGAHGQQTALMIKGIEEHICKVKPQFIILYGDTNSTLAGAVAASKAGVDVVHIEAGLRSFNKRMPEEVNRIVCDHVSTLLFTPTIAGYQNLLREGFSDNNSQPFNIDNPGLFHCGDIMYDNSLYFTTLAEKKSDILKKHNLQPQEFVLVTIHRDLNTDNPIRLTAIFETLNKLAYSYKIDFILPLHPRTAKMINELLAKELIAQITKNRYIKIIQPVSFLEMIMLEKAARMIITDSGGVQK
ncbi:MAG TPA: UDP-N-acetylglucosamine 2-epimerase (non-hydrolyzing), partial [Bacteroidales bacterium]|nr:UDP-N-acetylglucosamine 2-epimerase (non-hydrolyzing) [Bacteroidales bacterium]